MGALVKRAMHARRTRTRGGKKLLWAMGLLVAYFVVAMPLLAYMGSDSFQGEEGAHGRRLSGSTECDGDEGGAGEAVMYFLIILFCFLGLAVVCDDFFVPSLELISVVRVWLAVAALWLCESVATPLDRLAHHVFSDCVAPQFVRRRRRCHVHGCGVVCTGAVHVRC